MESLRMFGLKNVSDFPIKFYNCLVLRDHKLISDELWVLGSVIINPQSLSKDPAHYSINCEGAIISPGLIDIQLNGAFGVDFADADENEIISVRKLILAHGVTGFCPTLTSGPPETYKRVLPKLKRVDSGRDGAAILGAHCEGPFLSMQKRGAHNGSMIRQLKEGWIELQSMYHHIDCIAIVTLAPEQQGSPDAIQGLVKAGVKVSAGHTSANYAETKTGVDSGVSCITHLFNTMEPFHHRDPGPIGVTLTEKFPHKLFYSLIADGNHVHNAALTVAHSSHPTGAILITDACSAMGLGEGEFKIGTQSIQVKGTRAVVKGTEILAASVASMAQCVSYYHHATGCSMAEALEAATLHPAQFLGIDKKVGTLDYGAKGDFVLLTPNCEVISTWINGEILYINPKLESKTSQVEFVE